MASQIEITRVANDRKKAGFEYWLNPPHKTYKQVGQHFNVSAVRAHSLVVLGARLFCNPAMNVNHPLAHKAAGWFTYNTRKKVFNKRWVAEHLHWFERFERARLEAEGQWVWSKVEREQDWEGP